jgi:hypothetical protein
MKSTIATALLLLLSSALPAAPTPKAAAKDYKALAARLQKHAIVVDTHEDVPERLGKEWVDLGVRSSTGHVDIPRLREGGVTAAFFANYVSSDYAKEGGSTRKAMELAELIHGLVEAHPNDLVFADSVAGIRAGQASRKDRRSHGHRGRTRDRGLARRARRLLSPRRPLHDAHAHQHQQLGGLFGLFLEPGLRSEEIARSTTGSRTSGARSFWR